MTWKVRHEGSPKHVGNLSLAQVQQGLLDGAWEPTDEVWGPQDRGWIAFENHPVFAELAEDLQPPPKSSDDEETNIDMNALIDVCLVLLIFFMLATTYVSLQKIMPAAQVSPEDEEIKGDVKIVLDEKALQSMIHVRAFVDNNGQLQVTVQNKPIKLEDPKRIQQQDLVRALKDNGAGQSKLTLLLEHGDNVTHGSIVAVVDAAKAVKIPKVQEAGLFKGKKKKGP